MHQAANDHFLFFINRYRACHLGRLRALSRRWRKKTTKVGFGPKAPGDFSWPKVGKVRIADFDACSIRMTSFHTDYSAHVRPIAVVQILSIEQQERAHVDQCCARRQARFVWIYKLETVLKPLIFSALLAGFPFTAIAEPLYPNSVASNDLDFILPDDPGACWSIAASGRGRTEMYDPRRDALFTEGAFHFDVTFPDQRIRINVHPGVGNPQQRAREAAASVSRLPTQMRNALKHVNILDGDGAAWEESLGGFFTLYDELMTRRLAEHDLDETVFHESAHVALDPMFSGDRDWRSSQAKDRDFITQYAADKPNKEDIAESALFVWTMLHHPGRLPADVEAAVRDTIPNRLEYLSNMMKGYEPPSCS